MSSGLGNAFCLLCGSESELHGPSLCEPCHRERNNLAEVPENVPWTRCFKCGMTEMQGRWTNLTDEDVFDELIQRNVRFHENVENLGLAMHPEVVTDRHTMLHLQIDGEIDGLLYEEQHQMRARMANGVCITCTRRAGNYYEATVQLRSSARRLEERELNLLRATLDEVVESMPEDPMFFVTSEGPVTGGYDVVLGSKGLARAWGRHLVTTYGGQVNETNSVVGRKDGVDVTRLTLLYRKPGYALGDVIRFRDELWRPSTWTKEGAIIERVDRRERTGVTWRDLEKATVMAQMHEFHRLELIQEDKSVGEFLDPSTWEMTAVRLPWDHVAGRVALVCSIEGEWFALPFLGLDEE